MIESETLKLECHKIRESIQGADFLPQKLQIFHLFVEMTAVGEETAALMKC